MISLSAPTYDPGGSLRLPTRFSNPYNTQRRGSVTATLDGGVSVYDGGYTLADLTLTATLKRPSRAMLTTLRYLVAYYGQVIVCCEIGAVLGIPEMSLTGDTLNLKVRIASRLDT